MLAPKFLIEKFVPGTAASVWFRNNTSQGAMRGRVTGWEEHKEEMLTFLLFELAAGGELCLPLSDVYLATLSEAGFEEARVDAGLEARMRKVRAEQVETQLRQAASGLTSPH